MSTLLIRADASADVGTGHVMRCLALAQGWRDGNNEVIFLTRCPPGLEERLRGEGCRVQVATDPPGGRADADATSRLAEESAALWVVVDGYAFDAEFQRRLARPGRRMLWIDDDGHAGAYCADVVLNQNPHAAEPLYPSRSAQTELLLGPRYALLRREFLERPRERRGPTRDPCRVLVTLGGSDPANVTRTVLEALQELASSDLDIRVVAGPANPHRASLERQADRTPGRVELVTAAGDMPALMAWADVAISAAGSTCWELAYLGVPSLVTVVAANQRPVAERLAALGAARDLGPAEDLEPSVVAAQTGELLGSPEERAEMSLRGQRLVDGEGVSRVLMRLRDEPLRLRRARAEDRELLWRWANDPEVRRQSFSRETIAWETHVDWFSRKIADPSCILLIALDDNDRPLGQVRFDLASDSTAEISISLDARARGQGYGRALVELAVRDLFRATPVETVDAFVRPANRASIEVFERAGFQAAGERRVRGADALHFHRMSDRRTVDAGA